MSSAIERAERYFDAGTFRDDLARRVAFRTESQVPESRPQLGIYLDREIAPAFQCMGCATEIRFTVDVPWQSFLPSLRRHLDTHGFEMVKIAQSDPVVMEATTLLPRILPTRTVKTGLPSCKKTNA